MLDISRETEEGLSIPLTIGGGIKSVDDIRQLFNAGADKVSINSAAISNPDLIKEVSDTFGSSRLCVAIDVKYDDVQEDYYVYTHGGKRSEERRVGKE